MTAESPKPRVFIVINTSWNIVNFRYNLIARLREAGYDVAGIAPRDGYSDRLADLGVQYLELPMDNQGTSVVKDIQLFLRSVSLLRRERPSILLCYTVKPNVYVTLAARLLGIPVINNVAGLGTVFIKPGFVTRIVRFLYWLAFRRAEHVFFQNDDDIHYFRQSGLVDANLSSLLPGSGVDLARFKTLPLPSAPAFRFLLIARLVHDKGIGEFVAAARMLRAEGVAVECCIVGFLDVENQTAVTRAEVDAWEAEGVIRYLGVSDRVEDELAACHCLVLPSYREGMSRTLLEGAASGRPLIATDVPGCRELVREGRNGFLVKPRDAEDLARGMRAMLALDAATLSEFSRASRELVEEAFDEQIVIDEYLGTIDRILTRDEIS